MKNIIKRLLQLLLLLVLICSVYAIISGRTYLFKAVRYNFANIDDYRVFTNDLVEAGAAQPWPEAVQLNAAVIPDSLDELLTDLQTRALVVIRNDSLLQEKYWQGYSDTSFSGSFSVAKSITSLLIGVALKEGKLRSLDEPVGTYLTEFSNGPRAKVTIRHLLTMSSGSNWDESYSDPLSVTTNAYYGSDIYRVATSVNIIHQPGSFHDYKSGDTQLLGLILEKATGQSLSAYASDKLWKPLGAEQSALWSTDDKGGHVKAYCCFNTNAKDFARIGQLMLDSGQWKGREIISPDYYSRSITACRIPDALGQPCEYYGYQWWLVPYRPGIFYARGILGQYIIVIPSKKMVIVRLGEKRSPYRFQTVPKEVNDLIEWGYSL